MTAAATDRSPRLPLPHPFRPLTRQEECERILVGHETDVSDANEFDQVSTALDRQFGTIHNRAQLLLGICGILISASVLVATGGIINGRVAHQTTAGVLLVVAGMLEIVAAGVLVGGVLHVRWITQQPGDDLRSWIMTNLEYRDAKTRAYRISTVFILIGMLAYECAVAIALLRM